MTSLYMVITNLDVSATGSESDISFNYGTSLNSNGNIILNGTSPSPPGVSNFYSGVTFPDALPHLDQSLTIGDVYLCFGGTSMETINNSNRIEGKMLKGSETDTTRKFAFTSPNIHSNLGSSLGQFGSCASVGIDYDFYDKNLGDDSIPGAVLLSLGSGILISYFSYLIVENEKKRQQGRNDRNEAARKQAEWEEDRALTRQAYDRRWRRLGNYGKLG